MSFLGKFACFLLIIFASALSGCGGGGDGTSGTLALTVTAPADSTQPGSAVATYTAANGQNPVGLEINFSTDSTLIALDSTKQSVGSDGKANITFRTLPVAVDTPAKIVATTGGLSTFQVITIAATPGTTPVTPPVVSTAPQSISFQQAQPTNITLKGMGGAGLVETSIVSFIVKDTANSPLANQTVDFSLNTTVGGLTITPTSGVSDSNGIVRTIVNSGTINTPVRVTATVRGTSISVQSDQLVVSTGVPAQDGFSLSVSKLASETWNHDGVHIQITARLSDHFHNPVPDGTAVSFTTNGGVIQPSCVTVGGGCTVDWISQSPRPDGTAGSLLGRPVILAYAIGEENFVDANGSGLADTGEFTDTSEAFRDDNLNGVRDPGETFIDFNGDGLFNGPDGIYNGLLRPSTVTGAKSKHVFANMQLVMCTDEPIISVTSDGINPITQINAETNVIVNVTDGNGNTMAAGSKIAISTDLGKLSGSLTSDILDNVGFGKTLGAHIAPSSTTVTAVGTGTLTITVTNAAGADFILSIPIRAVF